MGLSLSDRNRIVLRSLLFIFVVMVACPIRYWPQEPAWDNTWVFAMNYAPANGLAVGRDVVFTTGPLGYLAFPQDIGNNLAKALSFQTIVWAVLIGIFFDLFFRAGFALRNLAVFSIFFSLSAPLYWFNYLGLEELLFAGALVLLVVVRCRGGWLRYAVALVLLGLVPLIKATGGMLAAGALAGFLFERFVTVRSKALPTIAMGVGIPFATAAIGWWCTLPSFDALWAYLKATVELSEGHSVALSAPGEAIAFGAVAQVLVTIGVLLVIGARQNRSMAVFFFLLLLVPLFVSFKHGFVRQDFHTEIFFCFAGIILALLSLTLPVEGRRLGPVMLVLLSYGLIWTEYVGVQAGSDALGEVSGSRGVRLAYFALSPANLKTALRTKSAQNFSVDQQVDPDIRAIVQRSPVAFLSIGYSGALLEEFNLKLYPVVQRYAAYTPYLDRLNAGWIREKGPRFLIFDGKTIDDRHPWAETPATWGEVYRWYNTRLLAKRNLLLERRSEPRFARLEPTRRFQMPFKGDLVMPESESAVFFTLACPSNTLGKLRKMLFRVPEVMMTVDGAQNGSKVFRIIPEVLASPVLGNYLPDTPAQMAAVLGSESIAHSLVKRLAFRGAGISSYASNCDVVLLRPVTESSRPTEPLVPQIEAQSRE